MNRVLGAALAITIALTAAVEGRAATITVSGADPTVTLDLPSFPSPRIVGLGHDFALTSVKVIVGGLEYKDIVYFYNTADGGGFSDSFDFVNFTGHQYYTGLETHPTFVAQSYLNQYNQYTKNYDTVTLTVPEPAVWSLMLIGLFCAGASLRSARRFHGAISKI